jgi:hypothetical protein
MSLLQVLESGRMSGLLMVRGPEGEGHLRLASGLIASGQAGGVRGREGALALMTLKTGRFEFWQRSMVAVGHGGYSPTSLMLEAARLEDELERRELLVPDRDIRVSLLEPDMEIPDTLQSGLAEVVTLLRAMGKASLNELEARIPLAPVKVRLSLAVLAEHQNIRERLSQMSFPNVAKLLSAPDWYVRLLGKYPNGVRLLHAYSAFGLTSSIDDAVAHLARAIDAPDDVPRLTSEVGLIRLRSRLGGLVSLALLPLRRQHRERFCEAAPSANIVVLSSDAFAEEHAFWSAFVSSHQAVRTVILPATRPGEEQTDFLTRELVAIGQALT